MQLEDHYSFDQYIRRLSIYDERPISIKFGCVAGGTQ